MNSLLTEWHKYYFGVPLILICQVVTIIYTARRCKTESTAYLFLAYAGVDFGILFIDNIAILLGQIKTDSFKRFLNFQNTFIAILEATVYYFYFKKLNFKRLNERWLQIFYILLIILLCTLLTTRFAFITRRRLFIGYAIEAVELLFLIIISILYFYYLFKVYRREPLRERPSFWIFTGVFVYSLISIPYYLIHPYLIAVRFPKFELITALFYYTPIAINFLFISKAMKCKHSMAI